MLTYSSLMSLLEEIVFFHILICHIGKQIDIWRVKSKKSFEDALSSKDTFLNTNLDTIL